MPVTTQHPDYTAHEREWAVMRDALRGEDAVKAKGIVYLPKTAGQECVERQEGQAAAHFYQAYLRRAKYPRWVADAVRSMMGLVSRLEPEARMPPRMAYLEEAATADGFGITDLFLRVVREILTTGRIAIVASVDDRGQAYAALYRAEDAINWKEAITSGRRDLTLAVLREARASEDEDEFGHQTETVYRVLDLDEGRYRKRLLSDSGQVLEEVFPSTRGVGIQYLPVIFAGSTDNNPDVDEVPLLTMAQSALKSYQLSADYFEALHKTAHPQAWVTSQEDVRIGTTGPGTLWQAGEGAEFGYLEIAGTGIEATRTAMQDERNAALEAGARVVDAGSQTESGDARRARQDDQHASLHSIVKMAEKAVNQFIEYAKDLTNTAGDHTFSVVPDFSAVDVLPQLAQQLLNSAMAGYTSPEAYWEYLRTGKVPDRDYSTERLHVDNPGGVDDEAA